MLGRKTYTRDEIDRARTGIETQLSTYRDLVATLDAGATGAREAFDAAFSTTVLLALDRPFVHRVRLVTGKDHHPLNEVEVLVDSLIDNNGVLLGKTVVKLDPAASVTGLTPGDRIVLTEEQLTRLCAAFFAELEARFLEP